MDSDAPSSQPPTSPAHLGVILMMYAPDQDTPSEALAIVLPMAARPGRNALLVDVIAQLISRSVEEEERPPAPIPEAMLVACEPKSDDVCSICLEHAGAGAAGGWAALSLCSHRFHAGCIRRWQNPSCPVCRASYRAADAQ
jgi:hypothetical protein